MSQQASELRQRAHRPLRPPSCASDRSRLWRADSTQPHRSPYSQKPKNRVAHGGKTRECGVLSEWRHWRSRVPRPEREGEARRERARAARERQRGGARWRRAGRGAVLSYRAVACVSCGCMQERRKFEKTLFERAQTPAQWTITRTGRSNCVTVGCTNAPTPCRSTSEHGRTQ